MRRLVNLGKLICNNSAHVIFVLCATMAIALAAQTPVWAVSFKTLHSFDGTDGLGPYAGLVQATNGNLYGTTQFGGINGYGTVFKIAVNGMLTTLDSFDGTDGANPFAGLIQASNGNLYGTAYYGGSNNSGTVFKIAPNGTLTTLYSFCSESNCADGANPYAALIQATNGNLYGTTEVGGANGDGTVFKVSSNGTLTTLYSFCSKSDCSDGVEPFAGLVQGINGNFYGTTGGGGSKGLGTVFEITANGKLMTLHSFDGADGSEPLGALIQANNGNLYGTTEFGGAGAESNGTVFEITANGTLTTLHTFSGTDGSLPQARLIQATNGNLYGTTAEGGASPEDGTVFEITLGGTLTTLHSFCSQSNCADGETPYGELVQGTNGNLYGTTVGGGTDNSGTVFEVTP